MSPSPPPDEVTDLEARPAAAPPRRLDAAFMRRHPAHWIALGFGSGLSPRAPGTLGTLWGWASFVLLDRWVQQAAGPAGWGLMLVLGFGIGWWACTTTARHAGLDDPGAIVWDEILAFWGVLWLLGPLGGFWGQLVAFALFRYFDAAKPGPVRWADRHFKGGGWRGGFGILFDDLVAAGCTLFSIALFVAVWRAGT
ncbi:MAG: phosphatidylglycerophosphatase A [Burkholderiaceae bacterium]|nr:phosphatidylglycerophosphatase A [Burkholderiaceae bacterium]